MLKYRQSLVLSCLAVALSLNAATISAQTPPGMNEDQSKGPAIINAIQARYPPVAIRLHHQGVVEVLVTVDAAGNAIDARVHKSPGYPELDRAATEAALKSGYYPYLKDGVPTQSTLIIPVTFDPGQM